MSWQPKAMSIAKCGSVYNKACIKYDLLLTKYLFVLHLQVAAMMGSENYVSFTWLRIP